MNPDQEPSLPPGYHDLAASIEERDAELSPTPPTPEWEQRLRKYALTIDDAIEMFRTELDRAREEERNRIRAAVEIPPLDHQSWCDSLDEGSKHRCNCSVSDAFYLIQELTAALAPSPEGEPKQDKR